MKRSEMKKKIVEALAYAEPWKPRMGIVAEIILTDIEEAGMLPPTVIKNNGVFLWEWEPEEKED